MLGLKSRNTNIETEPKQNQSEVERIIKDIDLNNLSPMQAFTILNDLQEKIKG